MLLFSNKYRFWILCLQCVCLVSHVISLHQDYSYVLCFMENDNAGTLTRDDTSIFVMNPTNDTVHISVSRINASLVLFPGTAEVLLVQGELYHVIGSGIQDKGIHIQSNGSIAVEGMNRIKSSTDVFIVRPTHLLSNEYLVVTYCNGSRACQVAMVATNDDTTITIYFPYEVDLIMENGYSDTYGPNRNLPVVLQAHEVYQIQSSSDLTGVVVTSDFPLACFAGANQTSYLDDKMDHVVDALPPTQAWGYDYIFASNLLAGSNDIVKIIATEDNTVVSVDSCTHTTFHLNRAFDYLEDPIPCGGYAIHSNFKVVVAHIRIKSNLGMYFPFPTNIFARFYYVYVPDQIISSQTSSLVIYVRTNDVTNIVLNGTLLSGSTWNLIPNTEWSYTSVDVESGLLYVYNNLDRSFGGHLLVRNGYKVSVTNLIPVPYNESEPVCCEHLEYKIGSMSSTEGSGAYVSQGVSMETTASDIPTTAPFSTSTTYAETSTLIHSISETMSSTTPADTPSTGSTTQGCCVCVNNSTKTGRIWTLQELRELTMINKKNTSIAIRKLTSAKDDRMSAMGIGYCGIAVLCTVLLSIVSIDLSRYLCKSSKVSPKKQNCQ